MIPFNIPLVTGKEIDYLKEVVEKGQFRGDGYFTKKCREWLEKNIGAFKAFLSCSCTQSLEMASILTDIKPGDEVIMPSFTFVSTANAFVLRGAKIIFVDIRPDTMNIDEAKIEQAITPKTKAIVPVHYAGVGCEMDTIMRIALKHNLYVIEDAAQGVMAKYKGRALGSIGHIGCYSFHETKNYHYGEGGAILLRDTQLIEMAETIRNKGTNQLAFVRGEVDKYTWIAMGSSYLTSELNAAFLYAQLESAQEVLKKRLKLWVRYYVNLPGYDPCEESHLQRPSIPSDCRQHNAHTFWIKLKDKEERDLMIKHLADNGIQAVFHYVPLHTSPAGKKFGEFRGEDKYTTKESERLLRLPLYYSLSLNDVDMICNIVRGFWK